MTAKLTRRAALLAAVSAGAVACGPRPAQAPPYKGEVTFNHGVASGDPGADSVVLWTRVSPERDGDVPVRWAIARDRRLTRILASGYFTTNAARDYTVKVEARGLRPGQTYYYGFLVNDARSPIGRTKTLPRGGLGSLRIAAVSCADYAAGFFNVYEAVSKRRDVDVVLHLGDYIDEHGLDANSGGLALGRTPEPAVEITSLADYRARHGQYKTDPDLQAAHASAPFICVWDDHEIAAQAWLGGAENHQPNEGLFGARKAAALQAYYEWMPIRDPEPGKPLESSHRAFQFGDLATLIMLETRLQARTQQLDYSRDLTLLSTDWDISRPGAPKPVVLGQPIPRSVRRLPTPYDTRYDPPRPILDWAIASAADPAAPPPNVSFLPDAAAFKQRLEDPQRALLGQAQERWIADQLAASQQARSTWAVFGNQVLMARLAYPARATLSRVEQAALDKQWPALARAVALQALGLPPALDSWNGYPAQRNRFYKMLEDSDANVIVLTGDTRAAWANELMSGEGRARVADEFGVSPVTARALAEAHPRSPDLDYARLLTRAGGEVKWVEPYKHGYLFLTLTKRAARAEFFAVSTVTSKDYTVERIAAFTVKPEKGPSVGKLEKAA